jgi:uncharacterized protein YeaO (DUF488 family)
MPAAVGIPWQERASADWCHGRAGHQLISAAGNELTGPTTTGHLARNSTLAARNDGGSESPGEPGDGARVLVDRIWPRGLTKAKAALDEWCKHVAPSDELRKWYGHDPGRFEEFGRRYRLELQDPTRAEALAHLRLLAKNRQLTLLTATRHTEISEAAVLAALLQGQQSVR